MQSSLIFAMFHIYDPDLQDVSENIFNSQSQASLSGPCDVQHDAISDEKAKGRPGGRGYF